MRAEREKFIAYITKFALTGGIFEKRVELCSDISADMVSVVGSPHHETYHGNDWHRTIDSARERAEQMRTAKIASLRKSLAKFEKLSFTAGKQP